MELTRRENNDSAGFECNDDGYDGCSDNVSGLDSDKLLALTTDKVEESPKPEGSWSRGSDD